MHSVGCLFALCTDCIAGAFQAGSSIALAGETFSPCFIFALLRGSGYFISRHYLEMHPAAESLPHVHTYSTYNSNICPRPCEPGGSWRGVTLVRLSLTDHVTARAGTCLWSVHPGATQNAIISHQSNQPPAPGAILTCCVVRQRARSAHTIAPPPTSVSHLAPS